MNNANHEKSFAEKLRQFAGNSISAAHLDVADSRWLATRQQIYLDYFRKKIAPENYQRKTNNDE